MTEDRSKLAALKSDVQLQEHQQRIRDRIASGDNRLLLYHGLGSGKSLSSLAAAEAAGGPYAAVAPASLRQNYQKEVEKFTENSQPDILSYTGLGMGKRPGSDPNTVIFDEAHRLRNPNTAGAQGAAQLAQKAKNVLLLTGTPVTNSPGDLASLLGILHNKSIDPAKFERDFVGYKKVYPSLLSHLTGSGVGEESVLQNEDKLRSLFRGKIDYQASKTPEGVNVDEQTIRVPLSRDQKRIQSAIRSKIPMGWAWKLDQEFPLSRPELASLNSFMTGLRQSSLSTLPFRADKNPLTAFDESSKLQRAMSDLKSELGSNPNKKAIIYSNFINAGLSPYAAALKRDRIPYGLFHGGLPTAERQQNLKDYNEGKLRALLLGPAGAEGISTKGTNLIQLLDPHWHESRLNQARGRGLRFDSHQGLPEDLKNVAVRRYVSKSEDPSWLMRFLGSHRQRTGDEILETLAARKEKLNDQFRHVLQDEGTEKKQEADQLQKQAFLNALLQGGKLAAKGIRSALSSYGSTLSGQAAGAARKALSDLDEPYQKALSTHLWGPRGMVPVKGDQYPPWFKDIGEAQERDELFAQFNKDVFLPAQKAFYDAENLTKKLDFNKNMARALTGAGIGAAGVGGAMAMNKESGALGRAAARMALYPTEKRAISPQLVTRALFSAVNKAKKGLITPNRFGSFVTAAKQWHPKALARADKNITGLLDGPSLKPAVLLEAPTAPILPTFSPWPDEPMTRKLHDSAKYVHLPEPIRQSYENATRHITGVNTPPPVINNAATRSGAFYDTWRHVMAGKNIWDTTSLFHELGHAVDLPARLNKGQLEGFAVKYRSSPLMANGNPLLSGVFRENSQRPGTWARSATRTMTNEIMAWRRGSQMYRDYLSRLPAEQRAGLMSVSEFLKARKPFLRAYRYGDLNRIHIPAAQQAADNAYASYRRARSQNPLSAESYYDALAPLYRDSVAKPPANFMQRARTFLQQLLTGTTARKSREAVYARHRQHKELRTAAYKKFFQETSAYPSTKTAADITKLSPKWSDREHLLAALPKHLTDTQTAMSTPGGNVDKEMTDLALIARAWLKSQQQKELLAARLKKFQETAAYPSLALQTPSLTMAAAKEKSAAPMNLYSYIPSGSIEHVKKHGLLSGNELAKPENRHLLDIARPDGDADRWLKERDARMLKSPGTNSYNGPSAFFGDIDVGKIHDKHPIKKFETTRAVIKLRELLRDYPTTKMEGSELIPFSDETYDALDEKGQNEFADKRHHTLSLDEVKALLIRGKNPKNMWKDFKDTEGKYYAADVPHAQVVTPMGKIPSKYIEFK